METNINTLTGVQADQAGYPAQPTKPRLIPRQLTAALPDRVELGQDRAVAMERVNGMVYERAMARLRSVVDDARASLGLAPDAPLDISAEATADRIVEFALGAFGGYRERNAELSDDEAKQRFVQLIGGAIEQGISEARDILGALNALTPEVDGKINTISELIRGRLDEFLNGGG